MNSCSTKKNTFTRRAYHNLTGHYNMFWNGRDSYREGVKTLERNVKDNYNKILPVYNYGTEQQAQSLNPYMDKAIEKASLNVQKHSMFFERRERVNWIDDSYLLIGLSYFYKQEYNKASRTFEFVMNEYHYNTIRYEAMLWLGNSLIRLKKYSRAESTLDNLENAIAKNGDVPKSVRQMLPLVRADMYLKQEKYNQAKEPLEEALYLMQKKFMDARVRFILAQIYQAEGEHYVASEYYKQVIKRNPPYEMAFNAAINLATSYDTIYGDNSKPIVKKLKKMLKEDKNIEYRDQIYYALADISFKDGVDSLGTQYLALSVASSVANDYQKATSALRLANHYFIQPEYTLAQAYFDTAVQVLPDDFPDREDIILRTSYLTELVDNLLIVETEDSLQMLAALNEDARLAIIDRLIKEYEEEEEKRKEEEELRLAMANNPNMNQRPSTSMAGPTGGGQWYFYNTATLSYGFSEFKKKWGNRQNGDNWRLSNKEALFEAVQEEIVLGGDSLSGDSTTTVFLSNDPMSREYYLQNIPFTEEQLAASNAKIDPALFNLGFIYKDKLLNFPEAIESFESLINRYPGSDNRLQALYQLHRLYVLTENPDEAEYYKNLIVQEFPESDYAKLLTDPDYFEELQMKRNYANILYIETYEHYAAGHYYTVYSNSTRALKEFREPMELLAKFEYLRALSLGKIEVVDSLVAALDTLIVKYPNSEVAPLAQQILDYLKDPSEIEQGGKTPEQTFDLSLYNFNPNSKQIFALVVSGAKVNINALKVRISDFNIKYYNLDNLSITNILLDKTTHFVMVGNFPTIQQSMRYYNAIMADEYIFSNMENNKVDGFVIAQENYPVLYRDKDLEKYLAFFKLNYLEKE